jgi:transporter family-2 protein
VPINVAIFRYFLAFGAGISFVFQQAVNANLGSPWWAGFISYLGGTIAMLLMAALLLQPWPSMQMVYRSHLLSWTGRVFGAIYIAISILLLPRLGAATVIALIVAGQMISSLGIRSIRSVRRSRPSSQHVSVGGRGPVSIGRHPRSTLAIPHVRLGSITSFIFRLTHFWFTPDSNI